MWLECLCVWVFWLLIFVLLHSWLFCLVFYRYSCWSFCCVFIYWLFLVFLVFFFKCLCSVLSFYLFRISNYLFIFPVCSYLWLSSHFKVSVLSVKFWAFYISFSLYVISLSSLSLLTIKVFLRCLAYLSSSQFPFVCYLISISSSICIYLNHYLHFLISSIKVCFSGVLLTYQIHRLPSFVILSLFHRLSLSFSIITLHFLISSIKVVFPDVLLSYQIHRLLTWLFYLLFHHLSLLISIITLTLIGSIFSASIKVWCVSLFFYHIILPFINVYLISKHFLSFTFIFLGLLRR